MTGPETGSGNLRPPWNRANIYFQNLPLRYPFTLSLSKGAQWVVRQAQRRVSEAARLGLKRCILPESCLDGLTVPQGMKAIGVRTLRQAVNAAISKDQVKNGTRESEAALEPG